MFLSFGFHGARSVPAVLWLEGTAAAKARGAYTGRAPTLSTEQIAQLCERAAAGESKSVLAAEFGVTRQTIYNYLRAPAAR
ncbi:helix-turn-helix domain-containing protein [Nocardia fusca]|uniref:helix-turn-helix domain-containing protein n=1 Tax=Nocardia fusca TaxID=941183 RepID=UPI000AACAADA